ncbi:mannitol dehydrogenase family protein [Deinococcus sedimenti]|uniref:Mannitol 2-dehydrogenase n=1 Tax=Deinococcus sedimenti TaxID=1867090 RepID=A0ABQ2S302_9DEIO|nr:mannitol dehydrogenase family protein [Deinococcus sedimenti]GGR89654.1 mannitol 2-dehydrogenase [Deinococcus sedimenti]
MTVTTPSFPLRAASLPALAARVAVPTYDPRGLRTGIVHFGVGAFHRSHQAMYLDRLLNLGQAHGWAICGVGVLPGDAHMRDVLRDQNHLYTLLTRAPDGHSEARVIGAIHDYLFAPDDPEAVCERLAHPATRVVSLTVTEGGYSLNNATGEFDPAGDVLHDLQPGAVPRSTLGFLTEGLRRRRERGHPPFTVMSCDNIQGNGHVTRRVLTAFARRQDPDLADWIDREVAFPNSMVDRITPVTTDTLRADLERDYGVRDAWPVVAEHFTQWVLEDHFTCGRPPLELAGVQLVPDVEPYELMKLRLLNAAHQAMSYPALLGGHTFVHEVCQQPDYAQFLLDYMALEAQPTLHPVPGIDLSAYQHELIERFSNPAIQDTLARLIVDGSERIPKFLLPVAREQAAQGGDLRRCALVVAAWSAYVAHAATRGEPLVDVRAPTLTLAALADQTRPGAFLDQPDVFGDLAGTPAFVQAYLDARTCLATLGPVGALRALHVTSTQGEHA